MTRSRNLCSNLPLVPYSYVSRVPRKHSWAHATGSDFHFLTNVSKDIFDVCLLLTLEQAVPRGL